MRILGNLAVELATRGRLDEARPLLDRDPSNAIGRLQLDAILAKRAAAAGPGR